MIIRNNIPLPPTNKRKEENACSPFQGLIELQYS